MTALASRARLVPFRTVLVPMDFSEGSSAALDRALALPLASGARVEILHALPEPIAPKVRVKVETAARDALAQMVARARLLAASLDLEVTSKLARGEPYVEIIHRARGIEAELIVMGRHGRRTVRDLFGSTAARVVRMGDSPVLLVRGNNNKMSPYRRPLVATDLGDTSRRTLELALKLVGSRATLNIVHAFHVPFEGFLAPTRQAREEVRRPYHDKAVAQVAALVAPYSDRARWKMTVRAGDARAVVLDEAARCRADVIALGTHGRSGLSHVLIGSVAESLIADASCDVLVARPVRFSFALP